MAIDTAQPNDPKVARSPAELDASRLKVTLTQSPKVMPSPEKLKFGQIMADHMLVATYDPVNGWSDPEIKPYGPLSLDPASSCFHYSTNVFEGMKAYVGPDGKPRLFRPEMNMARMRRSADRVALPRFDTKALLTMIKRLIAIDARWIPNQAGHSLYIRPTIIGTRPSLGVTASDHAVLYVICSPTGPYFRTGAKQLSLLAVGDTVRAWPGGTGGYKLALNYAPTLKPAQLAEQQGYNQVLWLLGDTVTEAGAMNFFVVLKREDGHLDVITPPLNGTILPGITRDSCLALAAAHPARTTLPGLPTSVRLFVDERTITMGDLAAWHAEGRLLEAFTVGTAVVVTSVGRIGHQGKDIVLSEHVGGRGPVARALYERLVDIQEGKVDWEGWSVDCE
ncbi:branched-chain amino acid aminotransferase II [Laetiporus sulphureus 93-53]|uniref:Branched-chain-amino-acid aminotransferase n=1 Tax=Laetiporus sulphureus 93-53 TaxID=1314785 RepID=A0A165DP22_9APHY|nr:branched-chain amino acid aminotransferase II [Laetiporus sulphureus 93-53]KZT05309.1 branched-chain amino acid aminotransferase II [Laetiporus sulphureus 93-53]